MFTLWAMLKVIQCNVRDVTEPLQAEKANRHLAAIINSTDDAIISKTLDGRITSWNWGQEDLRVPF